MRPPPTAKRRVSSSEQVLRFSGLLDERLEFLGRNLRMESCREPEEVGIGVVGRGVWGDVGGHCHLRRGGEVRVEEGRVLGERAAADGTQVVELGPEVVGHWLGFRIQDSGWRFKALQRTHNHAHLNRVRNSPKRATYEQSQINSFI